MRHEFYRNNSKNGGGTLLTGVKTTHYHEQCNNDGVLKFGNAIASSVEVEYYFGTQTDLAIGDTIWYYQVFDRDLRDFTPTTDHYVYIGQFYVDSFSKGKKTAKFVAYDAIKKLDVDYSQRLIANKANFPMTVKDLLDDISTYVGISIQTSWAIGIRDSLVNYFYVEGITARTLVGQILELLGYDVWVFNQTENSVRISYKTYSGNEGSIVNARYNASKYIVSPTDQDTYVVSGVTLVPVFYKENGLEVGTDVYDPIDCVKVVKLDGTVLGSYGSTENNVYYINNNIIAEHIDSFANASALSGLWSNIRAVNTSPRVSANLFPFRFPFITHGITYFVDTDGTIKPFPIMNIDWTNERVLIESYGASVQSYQDYDISDVETQSATIASVLNNLPEQITDLQTIVGDGQLAPEFTATDLTGAANEIINNMVWKSGDVMSGSLEIENDLTADDGGFIRRRKTYSLSNLPSSTNDSYGLTFLDADGNSIGVIKSALGASGATNIDLAARNVVGGNVQENSLSLQKNANGNNIVNISAPSAWLAALGLGTSGVLPITIAQGGSGQSAIETETSISNIISSSGSRFSVTSANYKVWGKVAQITITAKCTTAAGVGTNIATIASGKRPASVAGAVTRDTASPYASEATIINTGGTIPCAKSYAVNDEFVVYSTYLLP